MGTFKTQLLWDSIRKGDLSATVSLLENGTINPEERDEKGQTFLMLASECGELEIVREMLEFVDVNAVDNENWSALMCAAKAGNLEIVIELLEKGAELDHRDMGGWTPLMWSCYKGRCDVVEELLDKGANPNVKAEFNMTCLAWAAGRGHTEIVNVLLQNGAKVNIADKYGTTPLIWAARKGYMEIVESLLSEGANVDVTGMNSWTALLVATKGGFTELVSTILEADPNVNAVDKDGYSALTIAAKEGYIEIAHDLLARGAYVNVADRAGDTILIHAVKTGHVEIVRALLNKYADVDVQGCEGKTALYWAVEKGHVEIARSLLDNDPDLEMCTKDEDTALMRAVRNRNEHCVRLLLDKGAKVSAMDKRGDTALHISLRARSKRITELLLRNPRNSRLLYRSNKTGETPYNIDAYHQKGILSQIFGHRNLNASDGENLLGYDIYSSALADILSDPSLNTPITVGLYAKWGSGKSFLLSKLQKEMKSFTKESVEEHFTFCWALFFTLLIVNNVIGVTFALALQSWAVGLGVGLGVFPFEYAFLGLVYLCAQRYELRYAVRVSFMMGRKLLLLTLLLKVLFCYPKWQQQSPRESPTVKFLFSESTRLVSVGGEKSLAAMVGTLGDVLEQEYGLLVARLFRVFRPTTDSPHTGRFKSLCCIPYFIIVIIVVLCIGVGVTLLVTNKGVLDETPTMVTMITLGCIVGLAFISNIYTWGQALLALFKSQKARILSAADNIDSIKMDGLMQKLKLEADLMSKMVTCMDKFTSNQTRLVVIVDGLDSCEQDKVLQVLDIIKALFSDEDSPFITILAVDPHIIIKGIESNLKLTFNDSNVNGFDYLRNAVHLPFYLQSQGMRIKKQDMAVSPTAGDGSDSPTRHKTFQHQDSVWSSYSTLEQKPKTTSRSARRQESVVSHTSSQDLSLSLTKNDYFSDINPRSMRRLLNIVAVTGRLLRAYNIDFNWHRLAAWTNIIEQWPYRVSWIIMHYEENEMLDNSVTLSNIYDRISDKLPVSREVEPLLEIDRNVRKLEAFLCTSAGNGPVLNVGDLKKFLPCTVNLDPYLRKLIRDLQKNTETFHLGQVFPRSPSAGGLPAGHMAVNGPMNAPMVGHMTAQNKMNEQTLPHRRSNFRTTGNIGTPGYSPDRGILHPHVMTPYGAMPIFHPGYMGYTNPYRQFPAFPEQPHRDTTYTAMHIEGYNTRKLSSLTVDEICDVVSKIQGMNESLLEHYHSVIKENNVCGIVLSTCDIEELGKVVSMKFGDWQLFKAAILSLRQQEEDLVTEEELEDLAMERESVKADLNQETSDCIDGARSKFSHEYRGRGSRKDSIDSRHPTESASDGQSKKSILVSSESSRRNSNTHLQERKKSVQIAPDVKFSSMSGYTDSAHSDPSSYRHLHRQPHISSDSRMMIMSQDSVDSCNSQFQPVQKEWIRRNDSVAKQIEFEKGLLHTAMLHFTEEDESEDTDNEKSLEENTESRDKNRSDSPPVSFMLSDDDDTDNNAVRVHSPDSDVNDTDPLLSSIVKQKENKLGYITSSLSNSLEKLSKVLGSNTSLSQQGQADTESRTVGKSVTADSLGVCSVELTSSGKTTTKLGATSMSFVDETARNTCSPPEKDQWKASFSASGQGIALKRLDASKHSVSFDEIIKVCGTNEVP